MEIKWQKVNVIVFFFFILILKFSKMIKFDSFIAKTTEEDLRRIEKDRIEINAAYDNVIFVFLLRLINGGKAFSNYPKYFQILKTKLMIFIYLNIKRGIQQTRLSQIKMQTTTTTMVRLNQMIHS